MKLRNLTKKDVIIEVEALEEYTAIRGNVCASGNDAQDKETEDSIIASVNSGNDWAWCTIKITVKWNAFDCSTYLGCCSYDSEEDFIKDDYYTDMVNEAIEGLNDILQRSFERLSDLVEA
jgi:hypothetical protein